MLNPEEYVPAGQTPQVWEPPVAAVPYPGAHTQSVGDVALAVLVMPEGQVTGANFPPGQ